MMQLCGVLLLDKPEGLSSNAALQQVRRLFGSPKAGHVGSLDPLATGMLPICVGEATKIAGELVPGRKCYRFSVTLGVRTDTGDREGRVVATAPIPSLARADILSVLGSFVGLQQQVPPMYSALKRDGQPLYRLARAGVEVERAPRQIRIDELELREFGPAQLSLAVVCSKGTYVRTLAEDIARSLGTCGHVSELRRLYVEPFANEPMCSLGELEALSRAGHTPQLLGADHALPGLSAVRVSAGAALRLRQGQTLDAQAAEPVPAPGACDPGGQRDATGGPGPARVKLYGMDGTFLGLGEVDEWGQLRPKRLFNA